MAASMPKTCLCCKTQITDQKSYRCVYKDVGDMFTYILWEAGIKGSDYLCKFCLNKLNRITRIDEKIPTVNVERRQNLEVLIKRFSKNHDEGELITQIKSKRPLAKTTTTAGKQKPSNSCTFGSDCRHEGCLGEDSEKGRSLCMVAYRNELIKNWGLTSNITVYNCTYVLAYDNSYFHIRRLILFKLILKCFTVKA